jgi:hypothetical protein
MAQEDAVERIKSLIYSDDLVQAHEALQVLMRQPGVDRDSLMAVPEISLLCQDMETAGQCLEMLSEIVTWSPVFNDNAISTFSKGSGNEFFVRAELQMHEPLFPLFSLFCEVDLFPEW